MARGGFLVKLDDKEIARCYAISLDYDKHKYVINEKEEYELSADVRSVTVEIER